MRNNLTKVFTVTIAATVVIASLTTKPVRADDDDNHGLRAIPAIFVGAAGDCGTGYPAGSRIVTSAWLGGLGLPDNGGLNTTLADLATNPNKRDPHRGLLLSKNGPQADCSAAGADIHGATGMVVTASFVLGLDYRNSTHCGAGAPRYNVVVRPPSGPNTFHFVGGCTNGVKTPAPQDPAEWTRSTFGAAQQFPPIPPGSSIVSLELIFDEGTDAPSTEDPTGVGLAVVDNLNINGRFIRRGSGNADGIHSDGDNDDRNRND